MIDRLPDICHGGLFVLFTLCAIQLLAGESKNDTPVKVRHLAALAMIVLDLQVIAWFLFGHSDISGGVVGLVDLTVIPFLVFLFMELTGLKKATLPRMVLHVLPFLLFLTLAIIFSTNGNEKFYDIVVYTSAVFISAYIIIYVKLFYSQINKYNEDVKEFYSNTEEYSLQWVNRQIFILLILAVIFTTLLFVIGTKWAKVSYYVICAVFWYNLCNNVMRMKSASQMMAINEKERSIKTERDAAALAPFLDELNKVCREQGLYAKEDLTRDDLAVALNTNHTTLTEKIKKATGLTFSEYIGKIRLEEACKMLTDSDERIDQIIYSCGFRNKSTFYRAFSDAYNCTPKIYRYKAQHDKIGK